MKIFDGLYSRAIINLELGQLVEAIIIIIIIIIIINIVFCQILSQINSFCSHSFPVLLN